MKHLMKIIGRAILSALLITLLMSSLPLVVSFLERGDSKEGMISRTRLTQAQLIPKEEPKEKEEITFRKSHALKAPTTARTKTPFPFTPDLTVGSAEGASVDLPDLETIVFEENEVDLPPKPIFLEPLRYPERARDAGIEGIVSMVIQIGREGNVEKILFEQLPDALFRRAIERQIRRWKFSPAMKNGVPVKVKVRQSVEFSLD